MGSASHSSKRKKKRSQKRGKKRRKTIREKTKKLKRRHDSVSCSYDDDYSTSVSCTSSSSEENCRSRGRTRSHRKRDTRKRSKKKIKRDSSVSDSGGDSRKKRKRSKRKRDSDSRKKHNGKKKRRREPSSSSSSSDRSRSCSARECSDDSEREIEGKEDKWERKQRDRGETGRERIMGKRSRSNSKSCSPHSFQRESRSYASEERVMEEKPPKRLKSIIVVMREVEETEVEELNRDDQQKDEIVYERDEYPSRSNDSNDGMSKGDALPSSVDTSDDKTMYTEEPNTEAGSLDVKTSEFSRSQRLDVERIGQVAPSSVDFGVGDHLKRNKTEVSTADTSSNFVDLETTLRQKALENLLKRQGKLPTKIDGGNLDSEVKNPDRGGDKESVQKVGTNDAVKHTSIVTRPPYNSAVLQPTTKLETGHHIEKGSASPNPVISRPKLGLLTSTRRLLGSSNTWRRDPTSQGSPRTDPPTPKEALDKDSSVKGIESHSRGAKTVVEKAFTAAASEISPSEDKSTKDETNEADEDSEFEQKTMTVMRGGELVQVSYKVKIPKKAPALARRQLKR